MVESINLLKVKKMLYIRCHVIQDKFVGSYKKGTYDGYFGEPGRSFLNPDYALQSVFHSDAYKTIRRLHPVSSWFVTNKAYAIRNQINLGLKCDEISKVQSANYVCKGICLYDLEKDPCETKNIANENPGLSKLLKTKLLNFWSELVPEQKTKIDCQKVNPEHCNGAWFPWKDKNVYCSSVRKY